MSADVRRSPSGRCVGFEDCLDGFVVHAEGCRSAGRSWLHGSDCVGYTTWRGAWPDWASRHRAAALEAGAGA